MDLFLGVHVVSHDEGVTIPSVLQQPRNLKMTVVRKCLVGWFLFIFSTTCKCVSPYGCCKIPCSETCLNQSPLLFIDYGCFRQMAGYIAVQCDVLVGKCRPDSILYSLQIVMILVW